MFPPGRNSRSTGFPGIFPTWLLLGHDRQYFSLKTQPITVAFPCVVRAYRAGEDLTQAIPVDVMELQSAQEDRALVLAKGRFTLLLQDAQGKQQQLAVDVR